MLRINALNYIPIGKSFICLTLFFSAHAKAEKDSNSGQAAISELTQESATAFQELNFNKTLVIEGRVEKPQVQFTLLKEPPPEKEIHFDVSFMQNILKMDRENTFKINEAINRQ